MLRPAHEEILLERLMDLEDAGRESTIRFLVEAQDWTGLPERFQREIERDHVLVSRERNLE